MCGEQPGAPDQRGPGIGSPPRVRGTARPPVYSGRMWRITPACAGNSDASIAYDGGLEDHPRVCGEQRLSGWMEPAAVMVRITPACAGNRDTDYANEEQAPDHPRVCGEQKFSIN